MSGSVKIFDKAALISEKVKNACATPVRIFCEDKLSALDATEPVIVDEQLMVVKSADYEKSESFYKTWNDFHNIRARLIAEKKTVQNSSNPPTQADLIALLGQVFLDITRRAAESPDLTNRIANEITNLNFPQTMGLQEFLPYRGEFATISGNNDSVPLIDQATGQTASVSIIIKALGWKTGLKNLLFNPIHSLQKVNQAVVDAYTDARNAATVGAIVGATFVASQQQASVEPLESTYDMKVYLTLEAALKKLLGLKDILTQRKISTSAGISILCNSQNAWAIQKVVNGQLSAQTTGVLSTVNAAGLPFKEILVYDQGINNGFAFKNKTLSYPGVTAGKCYIFVPQEYFWILTKRPLTMETGAGSVLELSKEERAWYFADGSYSAVFLGSSAAGATCGAGYGAIVEVTLPDDSDNT